jgi:tRNA 2-selenouridine synthase SelU
MSKESLLKKEFKQSDVQRVRNIVNKDFTSKTKSQTGYQKKYTHHKEGDIWDEGGKQWTIKNGIKQNITKLDKAKKAIRMPLCCPKCGNRMKKRLDEKMFKVHGFCFDCVVEYETSLKHAGLYEEYEKKMTQGNILGFIDNLQAWITESLHDDISMVTEQGDVEDWGKMSKSYKTKITEDLQKYIKLLREHTK